MLCAVGLERLQRGAGAGDFDVVTDESLPPPPTVERNQPPRPRDGPVTASRPDLISRLLPHRFTEVMHGCVPRLATRCPVRREIRWSTRMEAWSALTMRARCGASTRVPDRLLTNRGQIAPRGKLARSEKHNDQGTCPGHLVSEGRFGPLPHRRLGPGRTPSARRPRGDRCSQRPTSTSPEYASGRRSMRTSRHSMSM